MNVSTAQFTASAAPPEQDGDPTTDLVRETWAELLGLAAVGPDDDFFELGGHSLMVASAVARLGARLGLDLPPRALFAAPTPAEMAEFIAALRGEIRPGQDDGITPFFPDWVVPLQREGAGRPVFVFPAGHNEIGALSIEARVAAHVGRDHPFWGFGREASALEAARAGGIQAMAAEYAAQMRAIQRNGPFLLYANCAGGPYAWETARQLLASGEDIAGILFYEVPLAPELASPLPEDSPAHTSRPLLPARDYRPPVLPVDLTLLMTEFFRDRRWSDPWRQVALGAVETIVIAGETPQTPFARREERIARHVRDWIEQAEARIRGA